jgi:RNA polymerase-binding transcription factor DksA
MERGSYGECAVCGEPIDERRLQALPDTDRCVRCVVH